MTETDIRICKRCTTPKSRILSGKFDAINKRYTDESGKLWNGSLCPTCVVEKSREHMRSKRACQKTSLV